MATVQTKLLGYLRDDIKSHIANALVNIDGQLQTFPIYKTMTNGLKITVYVMLENVPALSQVFSATLVDQLGDSLAVKTMNVIKGDSGLLIAFEFEVKVEVTS